MNVEGRAPSFIDVCEMMWFQGKGDFGSMPFTALGVSIITESNDILLGTSIRLNFVKRSKEDSVHAATRTWLRALSPHLQTLIVFLNEFGELGYCLN